MCEHHQKKKVVLPYNGTHYAFVVDNGSQGVTNCYLMILNKKDLVSSARTYFGSDLIKWLGKNKFTQYNEGALIETVGVMDLTVKITQNDIYTYYGLTAEEIAHIEREILN